MSEAERPDQKDYWNENLDPQNLGGEFQASQYNYDDELAFYLTPDQNWALDKFAPLARKRVLDVGAGIGTNAMYMASQGATVLAIDIAHDRLQSLRAVSRRVLGDNARQIIAVKCAAEALPFRDGVFDHAYSKSVIIHTRIPEATAEIARTLRNGGTGVFVEPMTRNPFVNLYRKTLAPKIWQTITRYFTQREIDELSAPFGQPTVGHFYFLGFLAFAFQFGVRMPGLFRVALPVFQAVDSVLFSIIPPLRKFAWFATIHVQKSSDRKGG